MLDRSHAFLEAAAGLAEVKPFTLPRETDSLVEGFVAAIDASWAQKAFYEFFWRMPDCNYPYVAIGARPRFIEEGVSLRYFDLNPCYDIEFVRVRTADQGFGDAAIFNDAFERLKFNLFTAELGKPKRVWSVSSGRVIDDAQSGDETLPLRMRSILSGVSKTPLLAFFTARVLKG